MADGDFLPSLDNPQSFDEELMAQEIYINQPMREQSERDEALRRSQQESEMDESRDRDQYDSDAFVSKKNQKKNPPPRKSFSTHEDPMIWPYMGAIIIPLVFILYAVHWFESLFK